MNRPIRRVGYFCAGLILLLVVQLSYLQVVDADRLANDPRNARHTLDQFNRARGKIVSADGQVLAQSTPTTGDFKYQRRYPLGPLFAQTVGYQSFAGLVGNSGVEQSYDKILTGQDTDLKLNDLGGLLSGASEANDVTLSLRVDAQQAARDALGDRQGSVVAVDVQTGEVLVMYSNPTFDANALTTHDSQAVQNAFNVINAGDTPPALQRAYREIYPPGSTFKVVTAAAALDLGVATPDRAFPFLSALNLPQSSVPLQNFDGETCGGTLVESLVQSCNTTFGQLGLDLGDSIVPAIRNCGVDTDPPPIDLSPSAAKSTGPAPGTFANDKPGFAKAAIGQQDVAVSPLGMALIAAGIANHGQILAPHVVSAVHDRDGKTVKTIEPKVWKTCMTPETATELTTMMEQVVEGGTGTAAQIDGVTVAGKTGTAQNSGAPHAWFIAFAPAEAPRYAVAVIVPNGGSTNDPEATGGAVAAPIAREVLQQLLSR
jgi:peptidoglycan glycosyltransferase